MSFYCPFFHKHFYGYSTVHSTAILQHLYFLFYNQFYSHSTATVTAHSTAILQPCYTAYFTTNSTAILKILQTNSTAIIKLILLPFYCQFYDNFITCHSTAYSSSIVVIYTVKIRVLWQHTFGVFVQMRKFYARGCYAGTLWWHPKVWLNRCCSNTHRVQSHSYSACSHIPHESTMNQQFPIVIIYYYLLIRQCMTVHSGKRNKSHMMIIIVMVPLTA